MLAKSHNDDETDLDYKLLLNNDTDLDYKLNLNNDDESWTTS